MQQLMAPKTVLLFYKSLVKKTYCNICLNQFRSAMYAVKNTAYQTNTKSLDSTTYVCSGALVPSDSSSLESKDHRHQRLANQPIFSEMHNSDVFRSLFRTTTVTQPSPFSPQTKHNCLKLLYHLYPTDYK